MTKAFIFDFDGTLVDSEQVIYQCFQSITKQLAPNRVEYAKKILIGPPLRETASEILGPEHQDSLDEFVKIFIEMHDEQVIQHTKPYPEVMIVLDELSKNNIPMAISTNKREVPTKKLIKHFRWESYFSFIECSDNLSQIRNKATMIQNIINYDKRFKLAYFVGDTVSDELSAKKNQLPFIRAAYGYGINQDWKKSKIFRDINNFKEILKLI